MSSKDFGDWVFVQGLLGPRLGDGVAVLVCGGHHVSPDWVRPGKSLGKIDLVPEVMGIGFQVYLEIGVKHFQF